MLHLAALLKLFTLNHLCVCFGLIIKQATSELLWIIARVISLGEAKLLLRLAKSALMSQSAAGNTHASAILQSRLGYVILNEFSASSGGRGRKKGKLITNKVKKYTYIIYILGQFCAAPISITFIPPSLTLPFI